MTPPTVGRALWYWPTRDARASLGLGDDMDQPMAATIVCVHSDRKVNLAYYDHRGRVHRASDVLLLQGDEQYVPVTDHATWPPQPLQPARRSVHSKPSTGVAPSP